MKTLSITGFVIALLGIAVGIYNQLTYVTAYHAHMCKTDILSQRDCDTTQDMQILLGQTAILAGVLAFILCLWPTIRQKKSYLAYFGILLSVIAVLIGLMQATHMFDYTGYFVK
ncbi:MAG: hypothetical protein A2W93_04415 [Bacteroidetes bacterium GWF2_43_63]|nr:MAG: hypothetical protein A2W94_12405 [Bacteroidetes bacterium GWE2_42_42]OFY56007.1 MAG: hypothetical protein A2W93_04415 [Bacteroidetes bacterium GWF2_43_63]HBG70751.1 hypothetical protein [Bacteroidales bacterium]HCB62421.1 hypothetical protein [Bacteroidales bacterium]HCY21876.1 hypothetical protein [Bacteroidales bacterium]